MKVLADPVRIQLEACTRYTPFVKPLKKEGTKNVGFFKIGSWNVIVKN
jgi:hypothetical protein